jgi:tetratricopeptide (TPR) repeat protein
MSKGRWFSRLLGRRPEGEQAPVSPPWPEAPPQHDAEYRQHRDWGLRELAAGRVQEAMNALGRAVHLRSDLVEAHLNMGRAFERAGKVEAARRAYERALEVDLTCAEARSVLAALPPPPPTREDFRVGQVLRGNTTGSVYKVLDVRKGGFGAVYIVRSETSGDTYALKTFQARYLWSDEDRERFEREAITWVMLNRHPNIVTAHWVERIEGFPCLVLEYVPGGDLGQLLQKGPLPVERALELALQFCDGMAYAHGKLGIVHRDVKPSNCLLAEGGTLKVTDFGLARVFGEAQESMLGLSSLGVKARAQYTTPAGTPQYMAPEQFRAAARLDTRTDIYAFGVMLYQMLTRDLPPVGSAARAHIQENAAAYRVPEELLQLILRCVEPDPRKRPTDFGAVRQAMAAMYRTITGTPAADPAGPLAMGAAEWNNKGIALAALGRPQEALACYERGLEMDPHQSGLWNNKGQALERLDRYEEALACYNRAVEITPQDGGMWGNKGRCLRALGQYEEAIACYDLGLEIDSGNSNMWKGKGSVLEAMGRHADGLTCYERGLEIDRRDTELWMNKCAALAALARYEEALAACDHGLEINPRDSGLWMAKGNALYLLGRYEEALACYDRGLEITPDNSELWENKSAALGAMGCIEAALDAGRRSLEFDPCSVNARINTGKALLHLCRYHEALACFEQGLQVAPHDNDLWKGRALAVRGLARQKEQLDSSGRAHNGGGA